LCENFLNHTEFYSNELTEQLALGVKLLYCYCKCLIFYRCIAFNSEQNRHIS